MSGLYSTPVIGHRGACADAPENTLASIRRAAMDGARMVELDVQLAADGRPVIFHDLTVDRTTDGSGAVASMPLSALSSLDAGSWFSPRFAGETIPTLEEALETLIECDLALNLEIKPCPGQEEETARTALAIARDLWPADGQPMVISSFARSSLSVARDVAPDWPRALLSDDLPEDWVEAAVILRLKAFHLGDDGLVPATVKKITENGFQVAVWTVNDPSRAQFLWAAGVGAIFSDCPKNMLDAVM